MFGLDRIAKDIIKELIKIQRLLESIHWVLVAEPRFGAITVDDFLENGIMVSNVTLGLLPVTKGTATQILVITADGLTGTFTLPADATEQKFNVSSGAEVHATLQYADFKGNLSTIAETTFTADDTVPPEGPAGFGATTVDDTEIAEPGFPPLG